MYVYINMYVDIYLHFFASLTLFSVPSVFSTFILSSFFLPLPLNKVIFFFFFQQLFKTGQTSVAS